MQDAQTLLRFSPFELDLESQELRRRGALIKLQAQPLKVLALLAGHPGELIARDEIQRHVWGSGTFVDFDQGINVCIRQIRQALGDSAGSPRFVETVPRKGYRFLAPVEARAAGTEHHPGVLTPAEGAEQDSLRKGQKRPRRRWLLATAAAMAVAVSALAMGSLLAGRDRTDAATVTPRVPGPVGRADAGILVVLPFQTYSATDDDEYLGDGLTEELITEISKRYGGRLGVIARTSSMKYKHSGKGAGEIAAELGADYVLEGSVRRARERLRVTAQLIRAGDEVHLWAGNYDRALGDVIGLQSEVSAKIGQALALELQLETDGQPAGIAATGAMTYEAYLRGRGQLARRNPAGFWPDGALAQAIEHLERAIELDPGFAPAWVELSIAYRAALAPPAGTRRAHQALERALALDDASPRAHRALAMLRFYHDWDLEAARASFERALELDPGYAEAHHDFAAYYSVTGRHQEAWDSVQRALRLDPLSPGVASDVGWYYYFGRRYLEAIEHSRHTLELEPGYFWAKRCILLAAMAMGDLETAAGAARDDLRQIGAPAEIQQRLADVAPQGALTAYWSWRLEHLSAATSPPPSELATLHMALGDTAAALDSLELAHRVRRGWILPFLGVHPLFDPLRDEPRFSALVADIARESELY